MENNKKKLIHKYNVGDLCIYLNDIDVEITECLPQEDGDVYPVYMIRETHSSYYDTEITAAEPELELVATLIGRDEKEYRENIIDYCLNEIEKIVETLYSQGMSEYASKLENAFGLINAAVFDPDFYNLNKKNIKGDK